MTRSAPLLTSTFALLLVAHFVQALGYSSSPLLPVYLEHLGASRTLIGTVMATGAVGGLLLRPVVAWALDVVGRKITVFAGTLLLGLGMLLVGGVTEIGPLIFIARALYGIGVAALFTAYFTWAADIVPAARRTEGLAVFGVSGILPLALNPVFGELGINAPALRWVFPALGALILMSWWAIYRLPEPTEGVARSPLRARDVWVGLSQRNLWSLWLACGLLAGLIQIMLAFATVAAAGRGIERPAALWLFYAASAIAVRLLGGKIPDRLGAHNMVAPSLAIFASALLVTAHADSTAGFVLAGLLGGIGHGYTFPVLLSVLVQRSDARLRGTLMALFTSLFDVAALTVTPLAGLVADTWDDATMFAGGAVLAAAGLAAWFGLEVFTSLKGGGGPA